MKNNLKLIQPLEYNNLFSSYHKGLGGTKLTRYSNYKLPKITKLFPSQEQKDYINTTFFDKNKKCKVNPINNVKNILYKKQKKSIYPPILNTSLDNESNILNNKTNTDIISNSMFHLYKTKNEKINCNLDKEKEKEKLNKSHRLNVIYLNLFKSPIFDNNENSKNILNLNLDSFYDFESNEKNYNESNINESNKDESNIMESDILSQKLKEINNKSIIKIKNIFNETDFGKLTNDLLNLNINNISKGIIDKFIEKIMNNKNRHNKQNNNSEMLSDLSNINGERSFLITNNVFLDWILDNVRRKIELKNEYNQLLTTVWVKNLINREINVLKNRFAEFRKRVKFSNFFEFIHGKNTNNSKKTLKKNDKSNFTSSTLRSYFDSSYIKSFMNSSNINSNNNNNSCERSKNTITQNTTINEATVGFDFFDGSAKKISNYNNKKIVNIINPYNKTNANLVNKIKYLPFKKSLYNKNKNKTELNHELKNEGKMLFKNVYLNNPRNNKAKNFDIPTPTNIKSRIDFFNPDQSDGLSKYPNKNKNIDIIDKIKGESINDRISKRTYFDYTPKKNEDDFNGKKRRNSFGFSNDEKKYSILKIKIKNIQDNKKTLTPSKEIKGNKNKDNDVNLKPKFKNVILMNIDKLSSKRNKINKINKKDSVKLDVLYNNRESKNKIKSKKIFRFNDNSLEKSDKKKKKKSRRNSVVDSQKNKRIKNNKKKTKRRKKSNELILNSSSSSSSSSSDSSEENEKDAFVKKEEEINKKIRNSLVSRRLKTQKPKLTSFQINTLKKIIKKGKNNNNFKQISNSSSEKEKKDDSIISLSSVDDKEEINENIEIKKEMDILGNILSNNELYNLFDLVLELKKFLRQKNKTEDIINEIKVKKNEIKDILNTFFEKLLLKLTIKKIKEDEEHIEIFDELVKLKQFGIYSSNDLKELVRKILKQREKDVLEYQKDYQSQEDEDIGNKSWRRSSLESVFQRKRIDKINSNKSSKFKMEFTRGKRKKTNLIYNNAYLFKNNENDEENKTNLRIKKEIQDILNTDYGNIPIKLADTTILNSIRRKKNPGTIKRKYVKRTTNRNFIRLNDEKLDEELLLKNVIRYKESEEQLKKEEIRDKKIYDFFSQIQKLKKNKYNELDIFINQQMELNNEIPIDKNGGRLNIFLQDFHLNRNRAKYQIDLRNKRFGFLSPIVFTSPNDIYQKNSIYIKK